MENKEIKNINTQEEENPVEKYVKEIQKKQDELHGKAPEEVRPDFLLPQFKNVEEQAKSYKELQALQTKQSQELAKYKKLNNIDVQKNLAHQQLAVLEQNAKLEQEKLNDFYAKEINNLQLALKLGKITKQEAQMHMKDLDNYMLNNMQNASNLYKMACSQCGQSLNMVSPREFFKEDLATRNYLSPITDFLENNYKQMPKSELETVKNLIVNLENSLREEILNEAKLSQDNMNYRQNLTSTANFNPNNISEKIFTLAEIKKMKPEEFRKNQQTILEQFVANKIK